MHTQVTRDASGMSHRSDFSGTLHARTVFAVYMPIPHARDVSNRKIDRFEFNARQCWARSHARELNLLVAPIAEKLIRNHIPHVATPTRKSAGLLFALQFSSAEKLSTVTHGTRLAFRWTEFTATCSIYRRFHRRMAQGFRPVGYIGCSGLGLGWNPRSRASKLETVSAKQLQP